MIMHTYLLISSFNIPYNIHSLLSLLFIILPPTRINFNVDSMSMSNSFKPNFHLLQKTPKNSNLKITTNLHTKKITILQHCGLWKPLMIFDSHINEMSVAPKCFAMSTCQVIMFVFLLLLVQFFSIGPQWVIWKYFMFSLPPSKSTNK